MGGALFEALKRVGGVYNYVLLLAVANSWNVVALGDYNV